MITFANLDQAITYLDGQGLKWDTALVNTQEEGFVLYHIAYLTCGPLGKIKILVDNPTDEKA